MTTDQTSPVGAAGTALPADTGGAGVKGLGSDAFLKLLVTKLQNQDPTNPQSDTDFIAQLAQFSSLEQLTSINKAVSELASAVATLQQRADAADAASTLEGMV